MTADNKPAPSEFLANAARLVADAADGLTAARQRATGEVSSAINSVSFALSVYSKNSAGDAADAVRALTVLADRDENDDIGRHAATAAESLSAIVGGDGRRAAGTALTVLAVAIAADETATDNNAHLATPRAVSRLLSVAVAAVGVLSPLRYDDLAADLNAAAVAVAAAVAADGFSDERARRVKRYDNALTAVNALRRVLRGVGV